MPGRYLDAAEEELAQIVKTARAAQLDLEGLEARGSHRRAHLWQAVYGILGIQFFLLIVLMLHLLERI